MTRLECCCWGDGGAEHADAPTGSPSPPTAPVAAGWRPRWSAWPCSAPRPRGGGYAQLRWRLGQIRRTAIVPGVLAHQDLGGPMTALLVGSDGRAALAADEAGRYGSASQVGGQRAGTIILARSTRARARCACCRSPRPGPVLGSMSPGAT